MAAEAAAEPGEAPATTGTVQMGSKGLTIEVAGAPAVHLPVLLAEVAHAAECHSPPRSVVAVAAWELDMPQRCRPIWFLVVDADEDVLRQHLQTLSGLGAVRAEFGDEYAVCAEPIGNGGNATVFKVHRRHGMTMLGKPKSFAAKVMAPRCPEDTSLLDREATLLHMAQETRHPNIIRLHGIFFCCIGKEQKEGAEGFAGAGGGARRGAGQPCQVLLTDLCCNGDLHRRVMIEGHYSEWKGLDLIARLLSALEHIHGIGLVHRDVKPENVLLGSEERPILADFGLAARLCDAEAMMGRVGTPGFAAPELYLPGPRGEKVDVFSAGAVLYFALLAWRPFAVGQPYEAVKQSTLECKLQFPFRPTLSVEPMALIGFFARRLAAS